MHIGRHRNVKCFSFLVQVQMRLHKSTNIPYYNIAIFDALKLPVFGGIFLQLVGRESLRFAEPPWSYICLWGASLVVILLVGVPGKSTST